jgi:hypothetical protein
LDNIGEDNPFDYEKTVEISETPATVKFSGGYTKKVHISGLYSSGFPTHRLVLSI